MTYLRALPSTPENPAILPRPVQLTSSSSSRLDALLELRDEAKYLDLEELYKLCTDEIRTRHGPVNPLGLSHHTRGVSNVSLAESRRSLGTLREGEEDAEKTSQRHSKDSGLGSGSPSSQKSSSPRSSDNVDVWHSSPSILTNASSSSSGSVPGLQQRVLMRGLWNIESEIFGGRKAKTTNPKMIQCWTPLYVFGACPSGVLTRIWGKFGLPGARRHGEMNDPHSLGKEQVFAL